MIQCYNDFVAALLSAGFTVGGHNGEGVYALGEQFGDRVNWHTGDPDTDPWQWRMRVLDERNDIAYGKMFFRKSGFITRDWYPYFLAARRGGLEFEDAYADGAYSNAAKRVYTVVAERGALPVHTLRQHAGFGRDEASAFERALVDLQTGLFLTICGYAQKRSQAGVEYGWMSAVLCTIEQFWGAEVFDRAAALTERDAADALTRQVLTLNPQADPKKMRRFIYG